MNTEQAITIIKEVAGSVTATKAVHDQITIAIQTLENELVKKK